MKSNENACEICKNSIVYWSLAIPLLIMFVLVTIALWRFSPVLSLIYVGMWILANFCEGYCCADLRCPLSGTWCHPVGGFIFSSFIYDKFFQKVKNRESRGLNLFMEYGSTLLIVVIILFPIYWLYKINIIFAVGYPVACLLYAFLHFSLICPDCPVEEKCVTGIARKYISWRKSK